MTEPAPVDSHHYISAQADEIARLTQERIMLAAMLRQARVELDALRGAVAQGERADDEAGV